MQMVANWSIHETDRMHYTKLNLTRARNTGSSSQALLFPFLKGLRAEITLYIIWQRKGWCQRYTFCTSRQNTANCCIRPGQRLRLFAASYLPLGLTFYSPYQCRRSSENALRKGRVIWSDRKSCLFLLKHRAAYCFFKHPSWSVTSVEEADQPKLEF